MPKKRRKIKTNAPLSQNITVNINRELSALSRQIGKIFGDLLVVTDETLEAHSREGYKYYTNMLRKDPQLALCFRKRAELVLALDYHIEAPQDATPQEQERADWFAEVFEGIENFTESRRGFFKGIAYGFQPAEIGFEKRADGYIGIKRFWNRNPERFRFTPDGELRLVDLSGGLGGEPMPDYKFVINTWGSDETPYGEGLLRELFPLWFFKNESIKSLMRFTEKFGTPYIFATYPPGMPPAQQTQLLDTLVKLHSNSVGIGPEGSTMSINDPGRAGVVGLFKFILDEYVDRQYAKAILGQTLSTESESGTFALAKFQSKGQQRLVEADSKWHEYQFNKIIKNLHDINFGPAPAGRYPKFKISYEENQDIKTVAEGASIAVNDLGLPVGQEYIRNQLGYPEPAEDEEILPGRKTPSGGLGFSKPGFGGTEEINEPSADGLGLSPVTLAWMSEAVSRLKAQRAKKSEE